MIEYIKKNNIKNGDEILNKYKSKYAEFSRAYTDLKDPLKMTPGLKYYVEKSNIFRFCLIHDINLTWMTYFNSEDAKNSGFEGLRILAEKGNEDIVILGVANFFPCNGYHGLTSKARWYYCGTCVSKSQLIEDVTKKNWSKNIVHKYGFQWAPPTPYIPYS